jgi:hypothetical protein
MLLCRTGHCPAKSVKPRARSFRRRLSHMGQASGEITNALGTAQSNTFYRLSPEAVRLTVFGIELKSFYLRRFKKERWAVRARGREYGL